MATNLLSSLEVQCLKRLPIGLAEIRIYLENPLPLTSADFIPIRSIPSLSPKIPFPRETSRALIPLGGTTADLLRGEYSLLFAIRIRRR